MPASILELEKRLWGVADELRANSPLSSWEYSVPVLGLLFLRYADAKFTQAEDELKAKAGKGSRRKTGKDDYKARGVLFLPEAARDLLATLKKEKLVLDWRKRQQARAAVRVAISEMLDSELPDAYSKELYQQKCDLLYQHVYDSYFGQGRSIYTPAA